MAPGNAVSVLLIATPISIPISDQNMWFDQLMCCLHVSLTEALLILWFPHVNLICTSLNSMIPIVFLYVHGKSILPYCGIKLGRILCNLEFYVRACGEVSYVVKYFFFSISVLLAVELC